MSESETGKAEVDETEETAMFVVDADDYQKTRKLKAINDAKDYVRKRRRDAPDTASRNEWRAIYRRESEAVAMYGNELMPLIEEALEQGTLDEDDLETKYGSLREFVRRDGMLEELEKPVPPMYMSFYRQLERIQRKLGLGLEMKEDKGPAEI